MCTEFDYTEHRARGSSYYTVFPGVGGVRLAICHRTEYRDEILPTLSFRLAF